MEVEALPNFISCEKLPTKTGLCAENKKSCREPKWCSGSLWCCCVCPCWICAALLTIACYFFALFRSSQDLEQCNTVLFPGIGNFLWFGSGVRAPCHRPKPSAACPNPIKLDFGIACECTGASCGDIPNVDFTKLRAGNALIVTSRGSQGTEFMVPEYIEVGESTQASESKMKLQFDLNTKYQKIIGFGGAFTDAVAYNYARLNPTAQRQFIRSHFGKNGAGYTLGRVNMNGCDFSRMDYTLDNVTDDYALEHFCVRDDSSPNPSCGTDYKTTVIKAAQSAIRDVNRVGSLKLYASTWSAPLWLKDQNFTCRIDHGSFYPPGVCKPGAAKAALDCTRNVSWSENGATNSDWVLNVTLTRSSRRSAPYDAHGNCFCSGFLRSDPRSLSTWANFFVKFIDAYKSMGVDIWGITVQNEPLATTSLWTAMYYTAEMQTHFLANYLGPRLREHHPYIKIMIHDDDAPSLLNFAGKILENQAASKYVDGVAYHWYGSLGGVYEDDNAAGLIAKIAGRLAQFLVGILGFTIPAVGGGAYVGKIWKQLQKQSVEKFVLPSEACNGANIGHGNWFGPSPGNWMYGYAYSHDVLWQLRNNAAGWTDWNLMLDEQGGPNAYGNFVDAAVIFKDENAFYQQPMFFHLAHFAKYIVPGSVRIQVNIECRARNRNWCQAVGFLTPDKNIVVVITNDELTGLPMGDVLKGVPILSRLLRPALAGGEGKDLSWTITHGKRAVSGTIPWKGIQTVIISCGIDCEEVSV